MDISNLKNPFAVESSGNQHSDPLSKKLNIAIEDVGFSSRITNMLLKNNIKTVWDLINCSESKIRHFKGAGETAINEILHNKNIDYIRRSFERNDDGRSLADVIEHDLTSREKLFLIGHYGLVGQKQRTLDEMGKELSLTRERMRQIGKVANRKIRQLIVIGIVDQRILDTIEQKSAEITNLNNLQPLDPAYCNFGIIKLYDEIFNHNFLFSDRRLSSNWLVKDANKMLEYLDCLDNFLHSLRKPTAISAISQQTNVPEKIIRDLKNCEIESDTLYPKLTINQKIIQFMQERVVPVTAEEISAAIGISPAIVRSRMSSIPETTNIGRSIYALISNGYRDQDTVSIIYNFIKDQGAPVSQSDIINYVKKYKAINNSSVIAAIDQNKEHFTKFRNAKVGLSEWGIQSDLPTYRGFAVTGREAFMNIVKDLPEMFTNEMARQKIIEKYGDMAPSSAQTMYKVLNQLVEENILTRYNYTNTAIFKLN